MPRPTVGAGATGRYVGRCMRAEGGRFAAVALIPARAEREAPPGTECAIRGRRVRHWRWGSVHRKRREGSRDRCVEWRQDLKPAKT